MTELAGRARERLRERTGRLGRLFVAPGRVNLIGEHTDYNDGFVLPFAIDKHTVVAAAERSGRRVRALSLEFNEEAAFDLDAGDARASNRWIDYVEGTARTLDAEGPPLAGAQLVITSDIPPGGGLSSSAALEISAGLALLAIANRRLDPLALAVAARRGENEFVGAQVGIMDQYTAVFGRAGEALLLDCRTLRSEAVPLPSADWAVAVIHSGVGHELAGSAYNDRRRECREAVALLQEKRPAVRALRDVTPEDWRELEGLLPEPLRRRARHVVTENARTLRAAEALRQGDVKTLGRLMQASHASLRDDYEVSSPELDLLVTLALDDPAVAGARLTGGGFGGCTVNLVRADAADRFLSDVPAEYARRTGRTPRAFLVTASDGAQEIRT